MLKSVFPHFMIFIFAVCVRAYDDPLSDMRNECNETFPISYEYDAHLMNFGSFPDESDRTPMCFIYCIMDKTGMMDEDGTFLKEVIVEKLQGFPNGTEIPDLQEIVEHCVTANEKEELCERAYGFGKCLMSEEIQRQGEAKKEE